MERKNGSKVEKRGVVVASRRKQHGMWKKQNGKGGWEWRDEKEQPSAWAEARRRRGRNEFVVDRRGSFYKTHSSSSISLSLSVCLSLSLSLS